MTMLLREGYWWCIVIFIFVNGFAMHQDHSDFTLGGIFQVHWDNNWKQRGRTYVAWFKMEILGGMFSSLMVLAVFLCVLKDKNCK